MYNIPVLSTVPVRYVPVRTGTVQVLGTDTVYLKGKQITDTVLVLEYRVATCTVISQADRGRATPVYCTGIYCITQHHAASVEHQEAHFGAE